MHICTKMFEQISAVEFWLVHMSDQSLYRSTPKVLQIFLGLCVACVCVCSVCVYVVCVCGVSFVCIVCVCELCVSM